MFNNIKRFLLGFVILVMIFCFLVLLNVLPIISYIFGGLLFIAVIGYTSWLIGLSILG